MKLATTTSDFAKYGLTAEESIIAINQAGFRYIDYSFGCDYQTHSGFYGNDWQSHADKMIRLSEKLGIKFVQAHSPMGQPFGDDEHTFRFIEDTKLSIKSAAYLGIPNIVVHSGHISGITKEQNFEQNKRFYYELLPVAEEVGINILTENYNTMWDPNTYWNDNAVETAELCDYINHPRLKVCWDTGHGNLREHTNKNLSQREALDLLGNRVYALHVQDNYGMDDDHIIPGFGTLCIDSLMYGLKDINFDGYFTFEADGIPSGSWRKQKFQEDIRCHILPLEIRMDLEKTLYKVGKFILTSYDCFEE